MNIPSEIDNIIARFLSGEAQPEEAIRLQDWIAASPQNAKHYHAMEKTFYLAAGKSVPVVDVEKALRRTQNKIRNNANIKAYRWAFLVLACLVVFYLFYHKATTVKTIEAKQHFVQNTLPDRSEVKLFPNSKLVLSNNYNATDRKLMLVGKASFEVEHDANKPFVVGTASVTIEDLGTVFTVESYPESDTIFVVVNEGMVRLYDQSGAEIIVKAGEKAWYIKSKKLIIADDGARIIKFKFNDTSLREISAILQDTYGEKIEFKPEDLADCKITTRFFDEDFATIINILAETMELEYEFHNGIYTLKGKPCQ